MRKFILLLSIILVNCIVFSQGNNQIDSLLKVLKNTKKDTTIINIYLEIGNIYKDVNIDYALLYYNKALENSINVKSKKFIAKSFFYIGLGNELKLDYSNAINYYTKSQEIYFEIYDTLNSSNCYYIIGLIYADKLNDYDKAIYYINKVINEVEKLGLKNVVADCYNDIGRIFQSKGNFSKALEFYLKSLKIAEELKDEFLIAGFSMNIGTLFSDNNYSIKAIEYFNKALKEYESINYKIGIADCLNCIGAELTKQKKYESALEFIKKSLVIYKEENNQNGVLYGYPAIGDIYYNMGRLDSALLYYNIVEDTALYYEIPDVLASSFIAKSKIFIKLKKFNESVNYSEKCLDISKNIENLPLQKEACEYLSIAFDSLKFFEKALKYHKLFKLLNDSIYTENSNNHIKKIEAIYQSEKKQNEIEILNKDKELQKVEIRKQSLQKYAFIGGFFFMILIALLIFKSYNDKKRANKLLAKQNIEINQKNEEISAQRDEIESQRNLVTQQKESIEEIHKGVTDSINYAKRIQEAVLPISIKARVVLGQHFILFKPKDIVSGDFYFATKVNEWTLVSVADCTGHGVPGAFMSMLGISFLNEIVRKKEITKASLVLNELRSEIINALQQKGDDGEQKDGMDISLVAINFETLELQFAGANNSLYIVTRASGLLLNEVSQVKTPDRGSGADFQNFKNLENLDDPTNQQLASANNEPQTTNHKLFELKPDKMPIGIHEIMNNFTNHEIQLNIGDIIYLFSDGYADQFGGQKGKKFMYKQFKELILANCQKSMSEQKDFFDTTIENWISGNDEKFEQTDDITVVGIKI